MIGGIDMVLNVGMVSLGCDKNRVDAEVMLSQLSKSGFNIVNDEKKADIIIVNTCGFIESAKTESIETILDMARNKESGTCKSIIVTGCMAERYKDELIKEMPEINAIVGVGHYRDIVEIIKNTIGNENKIVKTGNINYNLDYEERVLTTPSNYAYVKIAEGCNNNCSYCIIPHLRGRFRSKRIEDVKREVQKLAENGVKEVILVAQDTTKYGSDIYGKNMLSALIKELDNIEGINWIRIMYSYPDEMDLELIKAIKYSNKVCHYFDIPLQHISNTILKKMGRHTTKEKTMKLIESIRKEIPDAIIRTSIIVGFPGETEEDFNELREFLINYKLDRVGIFTYSAEEGTAAASMDNQISEETKESRKDSLMLIQSKISLKKNNELIGQVFDVMMDGITKNKQYFGRAYSDAPEIDQLIYFNSANDNYKKGDMVKINIKNAYTYDLLGEVVYESSK